MKIPKIHREGFRIIAASTITVIICTICLLSVFEKNHWLLWILEAAVVFFWGMSIAFFRFPKRITTQIENGIISPADGKVVVIEQINETSHFNEPRIQVSIFMSIWNVHINFAPFKGIVKRIKYDEGRFLVAFNPKSSELNERNSLVFADGQGREVMVRQIAGVLARRIVCCVEEGDELACGDEFGMIRFGSRVDLFLPVDSDIKVKIGDKVRGRVSVIGTLK